MLTTLEHLEHHVKHRQNRSSFRSITKEIQIFTMFFLGVFIISSVVVNAQLYQEAFLEVIGQWDKTQITTSLSETSPAQGGFTQTTTYTLEHTQQVQLDTITTQIDIMSDHSQIDFVGKDIISNQLQSNMGNYNLDFNMLPPTDRVIIPSIDVNTPMLQSSFSKHIDEIQKEDFDKDLYKGVVQYPTTPSAGAGGNTLIFGHTSYESWKHNPYATIFSQLPKLKNGDVMQIINQGKLYEYEVVGRAIVSPSKVNEEYLKYTNGDYLTLLGCYPIGSDKQRILIIGKLK